MAAYFSLIISPKVMRLHNIFKSLIGQKAHLKYFKCMENPPTA